MRPAASVTQASLSYRFPQIDSTPQHRRQVRRAVECEEADEPYDDEHGDRGQQDFCAAEEGQSCGRRQPHREHERVQKGRGGIPL